MSFKKKAVGCKRGVVVMYATTPEEAESIMWIWDLPVSVRIYIHVDKHVRSYRWVDRYMSTRGVNCSGER